MHLLFVVLYQLIQWLKFECSESEESCRWQLRQGDVRYQLSGCVRIVVRASSRFPRRAVVISSLLVMRQFLPSLFRWMVTGVVVV